MFAHTDLKTGERTVYTTNIVFPERAMRYVQVLLLERQRCWATVPALNGQHHDPASDAPRSFGVQLVQALQDSSCPLPSALDDTFLGAVATLIGQAFAASAACVSSFAAS